MSTVFAHIQLERVGLYKYKYVASILISISSMLVSDAKVASSLRYDRKTFVFTSREM